MRNKRQLKRQTSKYESNITLALKRLVRDFRERKVFYLEHSTYATYVDPNFLRIILDEIKSSKAMLRAENKPMSARKNPNGNDTHINTRANHMNWAATIARRVGRGTLLNELLIEIMALGHDLGHSSDGHEGERQWRDLLNKLGLGNGFSHNIMLYFVLMFGENLEKKVMKRAKNELTYLSEAQLEECRKMLLRIVYDMICHNGETADKTFKYESEITNEGIDDLIKKVISGQVKVSSLEPCTSEGRFLRPIDIISYIGRDYLDGCRRGVIKWNDPEYMEGFEKFGITEEEMSEIPNSRFKETIVEMIENIAINDLIKNSVGRKEASFSKKIGDAVYYMRDLSYRKVGIPSGRKFIIERLPVLKEGLIKLYSEILFESGILGNETSEKTDIIISKVGKKLIHRVQDCYLPRMSEIISIVKSARKNSIDAEVKIAIDVINGKIEKNGNFSEHMEQYIEELKAKAIDGKLSLTLEEIESYCDEKMKETDIYKMVSSFLTVIYFAAFDDNSIIRILDEEGYLTEEDKKTMYDFSGENPDLEKLRCEQQTEMSGSEDHAGIEKAGRSKSILKIISNFFSNKDRGKD